MRSYKVLKFQILTALLLTLLLAPAGLRPAFAGPSTSGATFIAYQSGAASVVLVFYGFTGTDPLDHYEITRNPGGPLFQDYPIPISVTSIEDIGQGLAVGGGPYTYTITVVDIVGNRASLGATYKDSGNFADLPSPYISLINGSSDANRFAGISWVGTENPGPMINNYPRFPAPIAPIHAKYMDVARNPATGAALASAQVSVYLSSNPSTLATLYTDRYGIFTRPNPITVDLHGRFEFYVLNGRYNITVSSGSISYDLTDISIADPRFPQTINADANNAALTLMTHSQASSNPDGNVPIRFRYLGNEDGNDLSPPFYRILANSGPTGWAMTYNAAWNESAGQWVFDMDWQQAYFFRIRNDSLPSLEFAVDPGYGVISGEGWIPRSPLFETLYHAGPDKVHLRSLMDNVGIERIAGEDGIAATDVVVLGADNKVYKARSEGVLSAFIATGVDAPNGTSVVGSKVYLAIGGGGFFMNTLVKIDGSVMVHDPLISSGSKPGYVVAAPGETDVRKIVGYSAREGSSFWEDLIWVIPR